METILVAGVDSLVGANFAVQLSGRARLISIAFEEPVVLGQDTAELCRATTPEPIQKLLARTQPTRIVYCGPGADSCWSSRRPTAVDVTRAQAWAAAIASHPAAVTLISSDAVFTGPWMFHAENSQSRCDSPEAQALLAIEQLFEQQRPETLIIRTHAFGFAPSGTARFVEGLLDLLQQGQPVALDCVRHASPLLATDLVSVIQNAWQTGLVGLYHVAGAERVNPRQFACRLAQQFGWPFVEGTAPSEALSDRAVGFGRGETSLQTRKIRRALGIGLPLLSEGLERLARQHLDGTRERLSAGELPPRSRVA